MITPSFPWLGQSGRDDPHACATQGVGYCEQATLDHAEQDITILAVLFTPILARHSKWVIEGQTCDFERYAVSGDVPGGLGIVPLEIVVLHDLRVTRIPQ
jgi:hypothetical protein